MDKERERNVIMCLCLMSSVDFQVESPTANLFLDMMQKKSTKLMSSAASQHVHRPTAMGEFLSSRPWTLDHPWRVTPVVV